MYQIDAADLQLTDFSFTVDKPTYRQRCGWRYLRPDPLSMSGRLEIGDEFDFDSITYTLGNPFHGVISATLMVHGVEQEHERTAEDLRAEIKELRPEVFERWERQRAALEELERAALPRLLRQLVYQHQVGPTLAPAQRWLLAAKNCTLDALAGDIRSLSGQGCYLAAALVAQAVVDEPAVAMRLANVEVVDVGLLPKEPGDLLTFRARDRKGGTLRVHSIRRDLWAHPVNEVRWSRHVQDPRQAYSVVASNMDLASVRASADAEGGWVMDEATRAALRAFEG